MQFSQGGVELIEFMKEGLNRETLPQMFSSGSNQSKFPRRVEMDRYWLIILPLRSSVAVHQNFISKQEQFSEKNSSFYSK